MEAGKSDVTTGDELGKCGPTGKNWLNLTICHHWSPLLPITMAVYFTKWVVRVSVVIEHRSADITKLLCPLYLGQEC